MSHPILVPLDGSPLAEHALPYATALAKALDVRVVLLHAHWPVHAEEDAPDLHGIANRLRSTGISVELQTPHLPSPGEAGEVILQTAGQLHASLIVMATHGRGGLGRLVYGSVADAVLRHASVPVLLVPPTSDRRWHPEFRPHILVPLDGSETAEAILSPLQQLAEPLDADILLLRVTESLDYVKPHGDECDSCRRSRSLGEEPGIEPVKARQYLDRVAERLRADGLRVETQQEIGQASGTIIRVARERGADLIAMATQGHGGLTRLVFGSVANETVRQAHVPILLVRP